MKRNNSHDGFGYDLDKALNEGNFIERFFHHHRISPWLDNIDYSGQKVLDIGCNTGILLIPLMQKGFDVVGVDIVRGDIAEARRKLKEEGYSSNRAQVADAKKLPFKSESFDIVLLSDILEHVSCPELVAKEALRVTKKNGLIYATVPYEYHPVVKFTWLRMILSGRSKENIEKYPDVPFSLEKLTKLFPKTEVIEKRLVCFWIQIFCKFKKL